LAVRTSPAAFLSCSILAEAAVEMPVVQTVHIAVAVEVEIPEGADVGGTLFERGAGEGAGQPVYIAVAVAVAAQPDETGRAVAVAVQLSPPAVVDAVRKDRQGVTAVRQRTSDELGPDEREHHSRLAVD